MRAKFIPYRCDYSYQYDYTTTHYSLTTSQKTTTPLLLCSSRSSIFGAVREIATIGVQMALGALSYIPPTLATPNPPTTHKELKDI